MLCNKQTKLNTVIWLTVVALAVLSLPAAATAQDVNDVNLVDPNLEAELQMPGRVEGTGTYFEVTDSNYINITFESTEPVHLRLESAQQMVVMEIEAANDANWSEITLGGFEPNTTYYKYEDDYHNLTELTTDPNGSYTYTQDLTERHLVFIQPDPSTIFLSDSGWSKPVGTWDSITKTGTLTQDVYETIQIDSDGITLDGDGFSAIGPGGYGVYLNGRTGVTIENLHVQQFSVGIYLYNSSANTLTGNIANSNTYGIYLSNSSNNILAGNTTLSGYYGIYIYHFSSNTLTGNTASGNYTFGILLNYSSSNTLTGNTASGNSGYGIYLYGSSNNLIYNNNFINNNYGICLSSSSDNEIYNNNFINNATQARVYGGSGNVFNQDAPTGGNYWSNWCPPEHPDNDGDGFVDDPYFFTGGQDNLPWAVPDGWLLNQPPLAVCQDVTVMADSYCEGVVEPEDVDNGSSDPDGDPITLSLSPEGPYPIGTTAVTLTVTDDQGASSACTATVKVLTASEGTLQLIAKVMVLNLHNGIENSLDAKLQNALKALDDLNANNDVAAINAIEAFINHVQAQRGDKISEADADDLIYAANNITVALQNGCY